MNAPTPSGAIAALEAFIGAELAADTMPEVRAMAAALAERAGGHAIGVLFYGSALRTRDLDGLLDFYVLLDDAHGWDQGSIAARANAALPPNVEYFETSVDGVDLRSKVAILTLEQFRKHAGRETLDTTIWARFTQPCALAWERDEAGWQAVASAVAVAAETAAWWAAGLGPERGTATDFWEALFRETYASELRVESKGRGNEIVRSAQARYEQLLPLAWAAGGIVFHEEGEGILAPVLSAEERRAVRAKWKRRRLVAKPLNALRLAKASFTFAGGADYIAWKIERHSGVRLDLTPWQRRHPILASGSILWRLWRQGVLR